MARKKRKYVPKVKGCYECSQRRIDCDGTRPSCAKCTTRGIPCSGFGLTYKFLDGFSSRRTSSSSETRVSLLKDALAQSSLDAALRTRPHQSRRNHYDERKSYDTWDGVYWESTVWGLDGASPPDDAAPDGSTKNDSEGSNLVNGSDGKVTEEEEILNDELLEEISKSFSTEMIEFESMQKAPLPMDLDMLEPWKEFLLTHFSEAIAPEMVVVDDCYNGWRHLILPLAWSNELVLDAVLAVSAFHISGRAAVQPVVNPDRLYTRAICQLSNRKDLGDWDDETKQLVILAIVVLLVSVMVNGLPDFPIVFRMLEAAIDAIGGEHVLSRKGEVGRFLLRQIRKMRVYAAPLLSQDAGVNAIMYHAQESFDCLYYYHSLYPDRCSTFHLLVELRQQAFNMYLHRVLADRNKSTSSDELIQSYRENLEAFPEGSFGEHVLIWSTFIAALECRTREQQTFFEQFLLRQYHRNRFRNILRALELLRRIRSDEGEKADWPALIPGLRVFIM